MLSISMKKSFSPSRGKLYDCKSSAEESEDQTIQGGIDPGHHSRRRGKGFSQFQYLLQEAPPLSGRRLHGYPDSLHRQPDLSSGTGGGLLPRGDSDLPRRGSSAPPPTNPR